MFALFDTFSNCIVSKHRTLKNAVKAQAKHLRAVQKRYGKSSYLTYGFAEWTGQENDRFPLGIPYGYSGWKAIQRYDLEEAGVDLD